MSLVDASDLATYLNDSKIDEERAQLMIDQAQSACETIVSPVPDAATWVVMRVAGRGYVTTTSSRQLPQAAGGMLQPQTSNGGLGGIWLSRSDIADLRRVAGGGGAFGISILPDGYTLPNNAGCAWDDPL